MKKLLTYLEIEWIRFRIARGLLTGVSNEQTSRLRARLLKLEEETNDQRR